MKVRIDGIGTLSTAHAASSYGVPVLLVEGVQEALGSGDLLVRDEGLVPAGAIVERWLAEHGESLSAEERALAEAFCGA